MDIELRNPWLVAVWPGMGGIAQIAGSYLVHELGARQVAEVSPEPYFDVRSVSVKSGLIQSRGRPKSLFFGWRNPERGHDLAIFVGDEQPAGQGFRFCNELLGVALELGVTRVFTFAAMATPVRPEAAPRVFAAATRLDLLDEVRRQEVELLGVAEISGLNGVLLAAAAERDIPAICLLGEFPFFASAIANPKASAAVLRTFAGLAGITLDLSQLDAQAAEVERMLVEHLRILEQGAELASGSARGTEAEAPEGGPQKEDPEPDLKARIEALFKATEGDRSKALALKAELDRHGVFEEYEDRFLDLFRQAE